MDCAIKNVGQELVSFEAQGDTDNMWRVISGTIADCFRGYLKNHEVDCNPKDFALYGGPHLATAPVFPSFQVDTGAKTANSCITTHKQLTSFKLARSAASLLA
eukprot:10475954-Karenia_brevis.AAC.1